MSYLLDTNVLSAIAPLAINRPAHFVQWLERNSTKIFLSTISAAEILNGITRLRRLGAAQKAMRLTQWWETVVYLYQHRILPFDMSAAASAGLLLDKARAAGMAPGFADVAIAAIAQANGLELWTRNMRHFAPIYDRVADPLSAGFELPLG